MINENDGEQAALAIIKFIKVLFIWVFKVLVALLIISGIIIIISEDRFKWNDLYKYKDPYYSYNHKTESNGYPTTLEELDKMVGSGYALLDNPVEYNPSPNSISLEELDKMMNKSVLTDKEFQRKEFLSAKCELTDKEMIELKELSKKPISPEQFESLKPSNKKCL